MIVVVNRITAKKNIERAERASPRKNLKRKNPKRKTQKGVASGILNESLRVAKCSKSD